MCYICTAYKFQFGEPRDLGVNVMKERTRTLLALFIILLFILSMAASALLILLGQ